MFVGEPALEIREYTNTVSTVHDLGKVLIKVFLLHAVIPVFANAKSWLNIKFHSRYDSERTKVNDGTQKSVRIFFSGKCV